MESVLKKPLIDTRPYVLIDVSNSKDDLFHSSDPLEIQKHNLNGLGIGALIDINDVEYVVKDLSVAVLSSPLEATTKSGRNVPYICHITIKVEDK